MATPAAQADPTLWTDDSSNNIGTVDPTTGAVTVVGNADVRGEELTDIGFTANGNLYAVSFNNLYSLAPSPYSASTFIGSTGAPSAGDLANGDLTSPLNYAGHGLGAANGTAFIGEATHVPEPASFALFGPALIGLGLLARRRRR